jgi:hypothetical protein
MGYSAETRRRLFILSGNECAFPGCKAPIYDTDRNTMVGEFCHIKGRSPGGPRYDPNQTEEERNSYANLMLMCSPHNKIIDDPDNLIIFPFETLLGYKHEHETRLKNTVVKEDVLDRFVKLLDQLRPSPSSSLRCELMHHLEGIDNIAGLDSYVLELMVHNDGDTTAQDVRATVAIPRDYMETGGSQVSEMHSSDHNRRFKYPVEFPAGKRRRIDIDPGDSAPLFRIPFSIRKHHYLEGTKARITVRVVAGERAVCKEELAIATTLNAERIKFYQGQT